MLWNSYLQVHTARGAFELVLREHRPRCPSDPRIATPEETERAWFSLKYDLESPIWPELGPVLDLYTRLTGERILLGGHTDDLTLMRRVRWEFERALRMGELQFEVVPQHDPPRLPEMEYVRLAKPESKTRRTQPAAEVYFEVRLVDEVGQPIGKQDILFSHGRETEMVTTNGSGIARYVGVGPSSAAIALASEETLEKELLKRWAAARTPRLVEDAQTTRATLSAMKPSLTLDAKRLHTIQFLPERGRIYLELFDEHGRVRHAQTDYRIQGPRSYSGTTDDEGRLLHDDVVAGNYQLSITVEDRTFETPAVVLPAGTDVPQVRMLGVVPRSIMASVRGLVFEKNKAFVLPTAIESLSEVRELCFTTVPSTVLVVGHADTTGEPNINDPLSLDRADCALAVLMGDVDHWLDMYGTSKPQKHRWGTHEDGLMIGAMPDYRTRSETEPTIKWFQRTRGLEDDNIMGPITRRKLIEEYMALVGKPLAKDPDFNSETTTHGCGENFPLDESGTELDEDPEDPKEDTVDRRVEFFFFDAEFGIQPPPPGKNSQAGSTEYPEWRDGVDEAYDFAAGAHKLMVRLCDGARSPIANAPCRIFVHGQELSAVADESGWLIQELSINAAECIIEWTRPGEEGNPYPFWRQIYLLLGTDDDADWRRLNNLGYLDENLEDKVRAYQEDFCLPVTGVLADIVQPMRAWHAGGEPPEPGAEAPPPVEGPYDPSGDPEDDEPAFGDDNEGLID